MGDNISLTTILDEIKTVISDVDERKLTECANIFDKEKRIFIDGEGRSGLMGKAFAMRLMHIGYNSYVIGETITPSVKKGDIYVSISGSGETSFVVQNAEKAKKISCQLIGVTSKEGSKLASMSDFLVIVPGTTKGDSGESRKSIQLLSTLFDQSVHIVLDYICLLISKKDNVSNDMAIKKHSNME